MIDNRPSPCAAATPGTARGGGGARGRLEYYVDLLRFAAQGLTPLAPCLRPHSGAQIALEEQTLNYFLAGAGIGFQSSLR